MSVNHKNFVIKNGLEVTNGQVGIGTDNPQGSLHIKRQDTATSGSAIHTDFILENPGAGNARFFLKTNTNNRNWEFFAAYNDGAFGIYDGIATARRFTILPSGNIGIGTNDPDRLLHLESNGNSYIRLTDYDITAETDSAVGVIEFETKDTQSAGVSALIGAYHQDTSGNSYLRFDTGNSSTISERLRITSDGKVGIGTNNPDDRLQITGGGLTVRNEDLLGYVNLETSKEAVFGPYTNYSKARGGSTPAIVQNEDNIGNLYFKAHDGIQYEKAARIEAYVDGTPGANDMPGRLEFHTRASGATSTSERLRITSDGKVRVPDNGKFVAGAGDDLQIYHDGTDSRVENSTGDFKFKNTGSYYFFDEDGGETLASFINDGSVNLYHNGNKKFETTSTGIEVSGSSHVKSLITSTDAQSDLFFKCKDTAYSTIVFGDQNNAHRRGIRYNAAADILEFKGVSMTANHLTIDSSGNVALIGELRGPASFVIDPAGVGDNTGTVIIKGNFQVDGTTTTINSTTMTVDDLNLTLASGAANSTAADGAGITIDGANESLTWNDSNESFKLSTRLAIGNSLSQSTTLRLGKNIGGDSLTTCYAILNNGSIQPDVTSSAYYNFVQVKTGNNSGTAYTINSVYGYSANVSTGSFNADSTVTNLEGFSVKSGWTAGTNNYGFRGKIDTASGTNRWNVYMDGTAPNYFAGNVGIGTDDPQGKLHISSGTSGDCELILESDTDNNDEEDNPRILFRQDGGTDQNAIYSTSSGNSLVLASSSNSVGGGIRFYTGTTAGYTNATEKVRITSDGHLKLPDNAEIRLGGGQTSSGVIKIYSESGTSGSSDFTYFDASSGNGTYIRLIDNGTTQTELWQGNSPILSTQSYGILVQGETVSTTGFSTNNAGEITIGTRARIRAASGTCFILENSNSGGDEVLRVESDGNVGIGTSAPEAEVHIVANTADLKIESTASYGVKASIILAAKDSTATVVDCGQISSLATGNSLGDLAFYSRTSAGLSEGMRIDSNGNIRINTTVSTAKLVVQGVSGSSAAKFIQGGNTSNDRTIIAQLGSQDVGAYVDSNATGRLTINGEDILAANGFVTKFYTTDYVSNILEERLCIDGDGNVGIGTSTPTERLEVDGVILSSGPIVDTVWYKETWPAYNETTATLANNDLGTWTLTGGTLATGTADYHEVDTANLPSGLKAVRWNGANSGACHFTSPTINLSDFRTNEKITTVNQTGTLADRSVSDSRIYLTMLLAAQSMDSNAEHMEVQLSNDNGVTFHEHQAFVWQDNDADNDDNADTTWRKVVIDISEFVYKPSSAVLDGFKIRFVSTGVGTGDGYGVSNIYIHDAPIPNKLKAKTLKLGDATLTNSGDLDYDEYLEIVSSANTFKGLVLNGDPAAIRDNYVGVQGADSLVLAADELNAGDNSRIDFRIDAKDRMKLYTSTSATAEETHLQLIGGAVPNARSNWRISAHETGSAGYFAISDYSGGSWNENFTVHENGYVGIGTDDPSGLLEVEGNNNPDPVHITRGGTVSADQVSIKFKATTTRYFGMSGGDPYWHSSNNMSLGENLFQVVKDIALGSSNNLNSLTDGYYTWTTPQPTNSPGNPYMAMLQLSDNNQKIQMAFGSSSNARLYVRRADSGTFYTWTEFARINETSNFTTTPQINGNDILSTATGLTLNPSGTLYWSSNSLSTFDPPGGGTGTDTVTDAAIGLASGNRIAGWHDGYIRTLFEWNASSDIEIGQGGTTLIGGINLLPGSSGLAKVNGEEILTKNSVGEVNNETHTSDGQYDITLFGAKNGAAQSGAFSSKLVLKGGSSQTRSLELFQDRDGYATINTSSITNYLDFTGFNRLRLNQQLDLNGNNIIEVEDIGLRHRIFHDGDTNTYFEFHAADQWRVVTGNSERLEVNNNQTTITTNLLVGSDLTTGLWAEIKSAGLFMRRPVTLLPNGGGDATSTTTTKNSEELVFMGKHWDGSASVDNYFKISYDVESTTPTGKVYFGFGLDNNASSVATLASDGTWDFQGNNLTEVEDIGLRHRIFHDGDTNCYIEFHANDQWRVVTGNAERLEVNNTQTTINQDATVNGEITIGGSSVSTTEGGEIRLTKPTNQSTGDTYIDLNSEKLRFFHSTSPNKGAYINLSNCDDAVGSRILTTSDEGSGNGLDADTLDGIQSTSFLRSDADDTATGKITFSDNTYIDSGKWFGHNATYNYKPKVTGGIGTRSELVSNANLLLHADTDGSGTAEFLSIRAGGGTANELKITSKTAAAGQSSSALTYNGGQVWHAGNDGAGSGLDADTLDGIQLVDINRNVASASANVGPGWITVATNTSARRHGEIIVSDSDSSDHAFIRIDWMRSYGDSNFTVINCGGHSNRITGARVLYQTSDTTYGTKKLQVYVTIESTYRVQINQFQNQTGWSTHSVVTPVVQNSISGYSLHGNQIENLDTYSLASEEGIQAGGEIRSSSGFKVGSNTVWHEGNDGSGSGLDADTLDGVQASSFAQLSGATFTGDLRVDNDADLRIGDGSANERILIQKADNGVSDHIIFYNGTTRMGEIGCHDTTWLRINQSTSKNIYTPRYIRADAGFFVDGTDKGINGSGNFIGGTIAGASDYSSLLRSDAADTMTGALTITVDNQATGALRILANQTNPVQDLYFAQEIETILSGSNTFTGDKHQGGLWIDVDSTTTGGGTSHEHRAYGIYIDLDVTGDADLAYGIYADATATPTTGTVTNVYGIYGRAEDNGGAGSVSNVIGVRGEAVSDNSTSDINSMYGGYFRSSNASDTGDIGAAHGCYAEIEISNNTGGDHYGTMYVFRAEFDDNDSNTPEVAQTGTSYLYYGNYAGTLPTNAFGIHISDNVKNHFGGDVGIGITDPAEKLDVVGVIKSSVGVKAPYFEITGGGKITDVTGQYGSVKVTGGNTTTYGGYAIEGGAVFMRHSTNGTFGLYDDGNNHWAIKHTPNAETTLYYDGSAKIITTSTGASIEGSLIVDSNLIPDSDNSGNVGTTDNTWANGQFTNFQVNTTLTVRGAIDLADSDVIRLGSSDDWTILRNANNWTYINDIGNGIIFQDNGSNVMRLEDSGVFRPETDGTGAIGTNTVRWANGYFDAMAVTGTITVRGAIDLADNDILRLGSGDDAELFCNGSHMYMDLNSGIGNFYIRDGSTTRYTFDDNGSFTATGNVTAYSDIKLKENIEPIANPLDKVNQINGVTFDRIDTPELGRQMGVIAQDVEKVCPELVSTDEEGTKSVAYGNMVGLLIEAIKDQQKQIDELKQEIKNIRGDK